MKTRVEMIIYLCEKYNEKPEEYEDYDDLMIETIYNVAVGNN